MKKKILSVFSEFLLLKFEKMPFISKDWRSPGEEWVKYDGGWEKKSVVTIQANDTCIKENTDHLDLIQQPKVIIFNLFHFIP